jgi:hypothetical protein
MIVPTAQKKEHPATLRDVWVKGQKWQINQSVTFHLIPNATNTKAEGTLIAIETSTATVDVKMTTIRPTSNRPTPQEGERTNIVEHAIPPRMAEASNWNFEETREGCGSIGNYCLCSNFILSWYTKACWANVIRPAIFPNGSTQCT